MKTEQTKIRLTADEMKEIRELADKCGVQLTSLCSMFVRSAMRAVSDNENRFPMPLKLQIAPEPAQTKSKK